MLVSWSWPLLLVASSTNAKNVHRLESTVSLGQELEERNNSVVELDLDSLPVISTPRLIVRAASLSLIFAPVVWTAWLAWLLPVLRRRIWYPLLARSLGAAGATFVKWAQWSATRADLFPEALRKQLTSLQAGAPKHSYRHTMRELRIAQLDQVLNKIDPKPLASGSIAQIHIAYLKNGQRVAVKVRHPRVAQLLALDSRLMVNAAGLVDLALPWLRLGDTVAQFSETLAAQARLDIEAENLNRFHANFFKWKDVRFPRPLFAAPSVLIETFELGGIVNELPSVNSEATNPRQNSTSAEVGAFLVNRGEDVYLKMLLSDKFMHADLHPGNLMFHDVSADDPRDHLDENSRLLKRIKRSVVLVDAGMAVQLTDNECAAFIGLIEALGDSDSTEAASCLLAFSSTNAISLSKEECMAFEHDLSLLFQAKCRGYGTGVDFGDVVRGILELCRRHHVRVDSNYATLVINALCLDGLAKDLYPSYSVLDGARPLLRIHRALIGPPSLDNIYSEDQQPKKGPRRGLGTAIFNRLCLPVCWRLKRAHDSSMLRRLHRQPEQFT